MKKKIIAVIVALALIAGAVYGIPYAVKKTTAGAPVMVVKAGDLNYGGYYNDSSMMMGYVTSDASQDIYLLDTQTVQESLQSEDQIVRLFALLDRRVGKRTLQKLREGLDAQTPAFRRFWAIRMVAEGLDPAGLPQAI